MSITLQTPKVYQYPETGRPDEGLEVYLWFDGNIDCYLQGRATPFEIINGFIVFTGQNPPMDYFDLYSLTFRGFTKTPDEVNNVQAN
jgi:hypothetical protein